MSKFLSLVFIFTAISASGCSFIKDHMPKLVKPEEVQNEQQGQTETTPEKIPVSPQHS